MDVLRGCPLCWLKRVFCTQTSNLTLRQLVFVMKLLRPVHQFSPELDTRLLDHARSLAHRNNFDDSLLEEFVALVSAPLL